DAVDERLIHRLSVVCGWVSGGTCRGGPGGRRVVVRILRGVAGEAACSQDGRPLLRRRIPPPARRRIRWRTPGVPRPRGRRRATSRRSAPAERPAPRRAAAPWPVPAPTGR